MRFKYLDFPNFVLADWAGQKSQMWVIFFFCNMTCKFPDFSNFPARPLWSKISDLSKFFNATQISSFCQTFCFAGLGRHKITNLSKIFYMTQISWFCHIGLAWFAGLGWSKILNLSKIFNLTQTWDSNFMILPNFMVRMTGVRVVKNLKFMQNLGKKGDSCLFETSKPIGLQHTHPTPPPPHTHTKENWLTPTVTRLFWIILKYIFIPFFNNIFLKHVGLIVNILESWQK